MKNKTKCREKLTQENSKISNNNNNKKINKNNSSNNYKSNTSILHECKFNKAFSVKGIPTKNKYEENYKNFNNLNLKYVIDKFSINNFYSDLNVNKSISIDNRDYIKYRLYNRLYTEELRDKNLCIIGEINKRKLYVRKSKIINILKNKRNNFINNLFIK